MRAEKPGFLGYYKLISLDKYLIIGWILYLLRVGKHAKGAVLKTFYFKLLIIYAIIFCAALHGQPTQKPNQRIFLFLKEPLRDEESVIIRLNNALEENIDLKKEEKPGSLIEDNRFEIIYQKSHNGPGNEILVDIFQGGLVSLDVYDFYGKKLGNLFTGYRATGVLFLNENEKWKVFKRFKGIAYFTLTIDGRLVKKKLLAKVE